VALDANAQQNEPKSPKAGAQTQTGSSAQTGSARTAELQARSYKGKLLDASCAMSAVSDGTAPDGNKSRERKSEASPSANKAGQSCSISTNTSQFALKLDDGQTVRFDSVGNVRAQEAIKDNKKWTEAAGSGKSIQTKVIGLMTNDKLMVISIN